MLALLVEDDPNILEVFKLMLESEAPGQGLDLTVDTARSGQEAIEKTSTRVPDIVLLDLSLPDEHGFKTFSRLKSIESCASLKIVAVSAHASADLIQEAMQLGFAGYVTKPIDFEQELFPLLRKLLTGSPEFFYKAS